MTMPTSKPNSPVSGKASSSATNASHGATENATWQSRVTRMVRHPQFIWFLGHLFTVIGLPFYVLFGSLSAYYRALIGAMLAYGVVLYRQYFPYFRSMGLTQLAGKVASDLNAHYFILALFFYLSSYPCLALLIPYGSFSIFHCLGYLKDILLPALLAGIQIPGLIRNTCSKIATAIHRNQPQTLHMATYWELLVTPLYLIFQIITFNQSFVAPIIYFQFLSVRYATSASTRNACGRIRSACDAKLVPLVSHTGFMGMVARLYIKVRGFLIQYSERRLRPSASTSGATGSNR